MTEKAAGRPDVSEARRRQARAAAVFKHAGNPTRLRILLMLSETERHADGLCGPSDVGRTAIIHHLARLRLVGLVASRRSGKSVLYSLTEPGVVLVELLGGLFSCAAEIRRANVSPAPPPGLAHAT